MAETSRTEPWGDYPHLSHRWYHGYHLQVAWAAGLLWGGELWRIYINGLLVGNSCTRAQSQALAERYADNGAWQRALGLNPFGTEVCLSAGKETHGASRVILVRG